MCRRYPRAIALLAAAVVESVSVSDVAFSHRPSPDPCESGSFSHAAAPLRSDFANPPCGSFRSCRPAGVSSLTAASPMVSTHTRAWRSHAKFRPQVFSTSRRLPPPFGFAGLLHPAATPRVHSVQGFLPVQSRPGSSPVRASMPLSGLRSPASRLPRPPASAARLYSLDRYVPQGRCLDFPAAAPLFGFILPRAPRCHGEPVSPAIRS
jgi:hypothetical protein